MEIIITGSLGFDYIMKYDGIFSEHILNTKMQNISLSFTVDKLSSKLQAGSAGNIAYTLSLFGSNPQIVGSAGYDYQPIKDYYHQLKIDTSGIQIHQNELSTQLFVTTDIYNNQIASCYIGAMKFTEELSLKPFIKNKNTIVIIAPNPPKAIDNFTQECISHSTPYIYAPGQQLINLSKETLINSIINSSACIINEYEIEVLKKITNLTLEEIKSLSQILVVTYGKKGSIIYTPLETINVPAIIPSNPKDPTGCGDAYVAAFTFGLINDLPLNEIGNIASLTSTFVLECTGTQAHFFNKEIFNKGYEISFKKIVPKIVIGKPSFPS